MENYQTIQVVIEKRPDVLNNRQKTQIGFIGLFPD